MPNHDDVRESLEAARASLRSGDVAGAEAGFRRVLARDPDQPEALHALARVALQSGRDAEAVPLLERAIVRAPGAARLHSDLAVALQNQGLDAPAVDAARRARSLAPGDLSALNTLGNALRALGRASEAIEPLSEAARLRPDLAIVQLNLAAALRDAGRAEEALAACERAAPLASEDPGIHRRVGAVLRSLGRYEDAERRLLRVLELRPDDAEAHNALGNVLLDAGERDAAEASYRRAIAARSSAVEAHYNLGTLLAADGRHEEALGALEAAARLSPDLADVRIRMGQACCDLARFEAAVVHFERALAIDAHQADAHNGLGNALRALGRSDAAGAAYRRAVQERPELAEAHCNLSTVALDDGELEAAVDHARRALALSPGLADAHWNLAQAFLTRGDLCEGWREYEYRLLRHGAAELAFPYPAWEGEPLADRTLLVTAEQGVGDEIMFASCLPEAIESAPRVVAECDARLVTIFSRSFPSATFVPRMATPEAYPAGLPPPDVRVALGGLPRFFRPDPTCFPRREAYLVPDPARVADWRARLGALGDGLKVGISWRGGREPLARRARSIPLPAWNALVAGSGVHLVRLQYGDCAEDLRAAHDAGVDVHDWDDVDPLLNLDGFAAQIAALDLVLSVDNSTVHMAGAVGAPTWVLLPATADWRWMTGREDSPWYASLKLFRQRRPGEWRDVFERVRAALDERVAAGTRAQQRARPAVTPAPVADRSAARPAPRREWVGFVNDTSYWYHWGCTATSGAIVSELERRGYAVTRVPISGLYACTEGPRSLEEFDDPAAFRRFVAANRWIWRELASVDRVVINGEGSLHGVNDYVVNLLYVAYAAKRHLGKEVQLINHSCYPGGADGADVPAAWSLYRKVYGALDHAVIREPVSHERMTHAGIAVTLGGDCLPLAAAAYRLRAERRPRTGVVLAGSVAARESDLPAYASLAESLLARGVPVTILTGANLLPAADEEAFANALAALAPASVRRVDARSLAEWFGAIAGAAAVVSGRFHHTIAAASMGTPFVMLGSNTPKNEGLSRMLGVASPVPLGSPRLAESLHTATVAALESAQDADSAGVPPRLADLCALAMHNFDRLPQASRPAPGGSATSGRAAAFRPI